MLSILLTNFFYAIHSGQMEKGVSGAIKGEGHVSS
jgi:hypothetical protein